MAEDYSKLNIFKSQIKAAAHSSEHFNEDADALLARIFACNHCFLDCLTIDAIVPIPKDVREEDDVLGTKSKAAVEGRLFIHWDMRPEESPDGALYQSVCIMPYKCWEEFFGDIRLRQETPNTPKIKEMVRRCSPCILKDSQLLFEGYDDGSPIETFELDWGMFEEFGPDAQSDYARLEVVLKLLRESAKSEAITMMLDKNYCPERNKLFEKFGMQKTPFQEFIDNIVEESAVKAAEILAAKQGEAAAKADKAPDDGKTDKTPDENKVQD